MTDVNREESDVTNGVTGTPERGFVGSQSEVMRFSRQAGGCLEIAQDYVDDDGEDIVHVCTEDVARFVAELQAFAEDTAP